MSEFLTNIGAIFQSLLNWLKEISSYLITNPIFIIIVAIGIFSVLYYTITSMIARNKANKKYKDMENWDLEDFDADLEKWKAEHPGAYEENGTWVAPLE